MSKITKESLESIALATKWKTDSRWSGIKRLYSASDVLNLRTSLPIKFSLAEHASRKLWNLLKTEPFITALGTLNGSQAVNLVKNMGLPGTRLKSIYMSGWQVAADGNLSGNTYPDQSLYPANSAPHVVKRINSALMRADQIARSEGASSTDWYAPIVADAEAGFGGPLNAFELMKMMIEAGAAGVHFEDQLASEKKCGHLGGKVLVPTSQFIRTLTAARLAADVLDVPTILIARTDSLSATLLTSDVDECDREFIFGERTPEGYFRVKGGIESAIKRGLAYAPYADLLWFETSTPNLDEARQFAEAIHAQFPGKLLAYNCSPSFNWKQNLSDVEIASFNEELGAMGFKYQFITLWGWHSMNLHSFDFASQFTREGMPAYVRLQENEFSLTDLGYTADRHQREVGTGYFDKVLNAITAGQASTTALTGSTEEAQFKS